MTRTKAWILYLLLLASGCQQAFADSSSGTGAPRSVVLFDSYHPVVLPDGGFADGGLQFSTIDTGILNTAGFHSILEYGYATANASWIQQGINLPDGVTNYFYKTSSLSNGGLYALWLPTGVSASVETSMTILTGAINTFDMPVPPKIELLCPDGGGVGMRLVVYGIP